MRRTTLAFTCLTLLTLSLAVASVASIVHVPGPYGPSIQAAIQTEADTVVVHAGIYPESLLVTSSTQRLLSDELASVRALTGGPHEVRGFVFTGPVEFRGDSLHGCWCLGGVHVVGVSRLICVNNNVVVGDISGFGDYCSISGNTVISGTISVNPLGASGIGPNVVLGPARYGMVAWGDGPVSGNYIRGCQDGILVSGGGSEICGAYGNTIESCSGSGVVGTPGDDVGIERNIISNLGGDGIHVVRGDEPARLRLSDNVISDVVANGVFARGFELSIDRNRIERAAGRGIDVAGGLNAGVRGNRVLHASSDGLAISARRAITVAGNVVGRCGGSGMTVAESESLTVRSNTCYENVGRSFAVGPGESADVFYASVDHNIAYAGASGLTYSGTGALQLACNDWFANARQTEGVEPGATDVSVDPMFCGAASDLVGLRPGSPLADAAGCGLIGALGVECDGTTETLEPGGPPPSPASPAFELALLPPVPNPAASGFAIAYTLPAEMSVHLTVHDVQGRIVAELDSGSHPAGPHRLTWAASSTQRAGMYFVRLQSGGRHFERKLALLR